MERGSAGAQLIPLAPDQILDDVAEGEDPAADRPEVMPVESHPDVTNTRQSGRVHDRNLHRPFVTRCRWRFATAPHAVVCRSPFGIGPDECRPRCGKCLKASLLGEDSASSSESSDG